MKTYRFFSVLFLVFSSAASAEFPASPEEPPREPPLGLSPVPWPKDNPYSKEKAELGRLLFYDTRLSSDGTVSCASCHARHFGFSDVRPVSIGVEGRHGTRNSPTVINAAYLKLLFWDGRASSLEEQCTGPLANPVEMTLTKDPHEAHRECCDRIQAIPGYRALFKAAFGDENCNLENLSKAIATFERTLLSGNSRYDKYIAGDKTALNEEELLGWRVFNQSRCAGCHGAPLFTDGKFYNIGVGMDSPQPDLGRYNITKNEKDWGAFKTPTLREIALTAPYMHDGKAKTLEEVVEFYDKGGEPNKNLDPLIKPLHLSEKEKAALVAFMKALSGEGWQHGGPPDKSEFP